MFTSVVINPSIVHIFGCIIPEPLHIAPIFTVFPDISNSIEISFETVSVVIIALAASFAAFSLCSKEFESDSIPVQILSIGSCIPITPVDAKSIEFSSVPSSDAAFFALCLQYSIPSSLVQALAIPEFITIAFTSTSLSVIFLSQSTGAAFTRFVVYVPADIAGTFEKIMAISVLFLYFIFASVALAKNPFGAHIPPFIIFIHSPYILLRLNILFMPSFKSCIASYATILEIFSSFSTSS